MNVLPARTTGTCNSARLVGPDAGLGGRLCARPCQAGRRGRHAGRRKTGRAGIQPSHHPTAISTGERAGIEEVRVRKIVAGMIKAQRRDIGEMMVLDLDRKR